MCWLGVFWKPYIQQVIGGECDVTQHLYLRAVSHHQPAHKRSVITILLDRVRTTCDETIQAADPPSQWLLSAEHRANQESHQKINH
jgi:hypothetical protein